MKSSFCLVDEPWLPVRWVAGGTGEVGLRDALTRAREVRAINTSNPAQFIALLRLLLALMHRAAPVKSVDDAVARLEGNWPTAAIEGYLRLWKTRLDLFHPNHPFLQAPWLAADELTRDRIFGLAKINPDWSSGNEKTLLDHHHEGQQYCVAPAEAARMLVTHQQFVTGGTSRVFKVSDRGGPATGFAQVWAVGDSLLHTLVLNQIPTGQSHQGHDQPAWECAGPTPETIRLALPPFEGPASRYVHTSRSILLIREPDGSVCRLHWAEGLIRLDDPQSMDPMEVQRPARDGTWERMRLDVDRGLWRDAQSLLIRPSGRPAATIRFAIEVLADMRQSRTLRVAVGGLLADRAQLVLWRIEEQPLPTAVLGDPVLHTTIQRALEVAEKTGTAFGLALRDMAAQRLRHQGKADKQSVTSLVNGLPGERHYWRSLEPRFWTFVLDVDAEGGPDAALAHWRSDIRHTVKEAWRSSIGALGTHGRAAMAAAHANRLYNNALATSDA